MNNDNVLEGKIFIVFCNFREVCKNEFIIPVIPELKELYEDEGMRHSLRSVATISIRPEMTMTDIEYVSHSRPHKTSTVFLF